MMKNKKIREKFKSIIVICHGKSELKLIEQIGRKEYNNKELHLIARDNGNSSIQISGLVDYLNKKLVKELNSISFDINKLKIYIVLDTDDCTEQERKMYISRQLFDGLNEKTKKYKNCIIPIYNTKNLEEILIKAGCKFNSNTSKAMKKEYITRIEKLLGNIEDLTENLKKNPNTNLEILIEDLKN